MSVHLVRGDDPILRVDTLEALVAELLGDEDRTLAVEDLSVPGRGSEGEPGGSEARDAVVAAAIQAAQSPPFMTGRRIVVLRDVGHLSAAEAAPLAASLVEHLPTTELILVAGGGKVPEVLARALRAAGAREHGGGRDDVADVLSGAADAAGIALAPDAAAEIIRRIGDEAGRVPAIVALLAAAFGPGARLRAEDVAPYLGAAGGVAPYLLTNAIEQGDAAGALEVLHRLLSARGPQQPKPMHPLQVLGMLHNHFRRVARLDDAAVRTTDDAVAALGGRVKPFPARKAREQAQRLGTEGIREAYALLAQADLDLKGARALPAEAVLEVLVTRLAVLSARAAPRAGAVGRRTARR